ncbi:spore coat associated protein CotJA [Tissierella carlieri]|uniref:Spore coat associated protein CotJA n=1 Tax=Tissierella carlieri TaxID=689904 RepID=A0ABT1SFP8_9FIRM|nr:spore coat associated protein CotJA [Tissierella carlieri]MBU5311858.1 spore coat associated protein CotJA [Tissierella carlieri]MCQ4925318.1 spore coat associated protein CotJA [Tissierella carlieri]MDU5082098.1 spore coat associated protein CotJA [Bacillota bacterium]
MDREYEGEGRPCCPGALARACVPFQIMNQVFSPREALKKGTLFPELYQPYIVEEHREGGCRCYG